MAAALTQVAEVVEIPTTAAAAVVTTTQAAVMMDRLTTVSFRKCLSRFGTTLITARMKSLGLFTK